MIPIYNVTNIKPRIVMITVILLFLSSCVNNRELVDSSPSQQKNGNEWQCESPPPAFNESDLYGEWVVTYGDSRIETLIINEDNTYNQVFINNATGYRYESNLNSWWLETTDELGTYLHLQDMLFCEFRENCISPEDAYEIDFYDVCSKQWITLVGEFVLVVIGDQGIPELIDAPPRDIALLQLRPPGREGPLFRYKLIESR